MKKMSGFFVFGKSAPKTGQLAGVKVGQDLPVHIDGGGEGLPGKLGHFLSGGGIGGYIQCFVLNATFLEPVDRLVAPSTVGFDKQTNSFRLHDASKYTSPPPRPNFSFCIRPVRTIVRA